MLIVSHVCRVNLLNKKYEAIKIRLPPDYENKSLLINTKLY